MRILFLGLAVGSLDNPQNLYSELLVQLCKSGIEVVLIAPTYPGMKTGLQKVNGITVIRVKTLELFKSHPFIKGVANILLPWQYKVALKQSKLDLKFDLVIVPTPPITLFSVAAWLKREHNSKVYMILRDIFPQNAVDLKMMRAGSLIYRYFRKKEKFSYKVSDYIGCMSDGNIEYIKRNNPEVPAVKLHLLPNWGRNKPKATEKELNALKEEFGINNKFIAIFGGNIGRPQKVQNILALAKSCVEFEDILFLLVGSGTEVQKIEQIITDQELHNVKFITERLEANYYFKLLQTADVGLISLSEDFTIPNIPSKALVYYNAQIPILASLDANTDFGKIIEKNKSGYWAHAKDTSGLKDKLLKLYRNPELRENMGKNGYQYFVSELLTEKACKTIIGYGEGAK